MLYNSTGEKGGIWGVNNTTGGNFGNSVVGTEGFAYTASTGNN